MSHQHRFPFCAVLGAASRATIFCALFLAEPRVVGAQLARDSAPAVDRLTMAAFERFYPDYAGRPRLVPSSVPKELASQLAIPRGASIDGTIVWPSDVVVLGSINGFVDSVGARFQREMVASGWVAGWTGVHVEARTDSLRGPHGISSYGSATFRGLPFVMVCRGTARATLSFLDPDVRPLRFSIAMDSVATPQACGIFDR